MKPVQMFMVGLACVGMLACDRSARNEVNDPNAVGTAGNAAGAGDRAFVEDMAEAGMAEVELGKLASEKGASADVKQFGERMVADHQKANDELKAIAKNKNVTLPTEPDAKHKAEMDRLSKLSGEAFDRAYMQAMVSGHKDVLAKFKTQAQSGKDPDVKAFAAKTVPTIESHLKVAESTNKAVATSGTKAPTQTGTCGTEKK